MAPVIHVDLCSTFTDRFNEQLLPILPKTWHRLPCTSIEKICEAPLSVAKFGELKTRRLFSAFGFGE